MHTRRITISIITIITLLLVCCGSASSSASGTGETASATQPNKLKIVVEPVTHTAPQTITVENGQQVQQLYKAIYALPRITEDRVCPMRAGPRYQLTFMNGERTILSANADSSECGTISLNKNDHRQPDQHFWKLLQQMAKTETPTSPSGEPDRLQVVVHALNNEVVKTVNVTNTELVQSLYKAAYALPKQPAQQICPMIVGPTYDLIFFTDQTQLITMTADRSGCGTVNIGGNDTRQANSAFWQLLKQTGVSFQGS